MDLPHEHESTAEAPAGAEDSVPRVRPVERLWPYAELSEHHSPEELAALDPDLRAALFGELPRPFSLTLVFPSVETPDGERAVELAKAASAYRVTGTGERLRHRARFVSSEADRLRELYRLVSELPDCEVLVDERPVPFARELWLPLVWMVVFRGELEARDAGSDDERPAGDERSEDAS